jgi:hypothetical protein
VPVKLGVVEYTAPVELTKSVRVTESMTTAAKEDPTYAARKSVAM